jgi:hypothetical protein
MKKKEYKITVSFTETLSEKDRIEREDKIISILVRNAIDAQKKKFIAKGTMR